MLIATHATVAGADGGARLRRERRPPWRLPLWWRLWAVRLGWHWMREPWPSRTLWGWCAIQWGPGGMPLCQAKRYGSRQCPSVRRLGPGRDSERHPFDDAVSSMAAVGRALPSELRETARGALRLHRRPRPVWPVPAIKDPDKKPPPAVVGGGFLFRWPGSCRW